MKNSKDIEFVDKIIGALRKSAIELEEYQVKATLDKAEVQDKYEEVKKKFNLFIHDNEFKIKGIKEKIDYLNIKFDELRVQLELGKADTKEIFKKQKRQLLLTLHDIEVKIYLLIRKPEWNIRDSLQLFDEILLKIRLHNLKLQINLDSR
mgnify:CR=1 FL=1